MADTEKALPSKKYDYVGYSTSGKVYHIYRPSKKGNSWMVRTKEDYIAFFSRTLRDVKYELGNR